MRILIDIFVIVVFLITVVFLYQNYWADFKRTFFDAEPEYTIYVGATAVSVTVADELAERVLGLSGVRSLRDLQGKLFVFDIEDKHGFWMKDMLIPIDIMWINNNLEVVHIVENVSPDTYPEVFAPPVGARFVLETNAHFVSSLKVAVGDRVILPSLLLPPDIRENLQE